GLGYYVHASELVVSAVTVHNQSVGKLCPMGHAGADPILISEIAHKEHRDDPHLDIQKHVTVFEVTDVREHVDSLFCSNRAPDDLGVVPFQKIKWIGNLFVLGD